MPAKWRFFIIANYVIAVFYLAVISFAIKAFFNPASGMRTLAGARFITFCFFVVLINSCFNIYIFHRHYPDRLLSKKRRLIHRFMTGLSIMAFAGMLWQFVPDFYAIYHSDEAPSFIYFISFIAAIMIINLVILSFQYSLPGSVEKKNKERVSQEINSIGNEG